MSGGGGGKPYGSGDAPVGRHNMKSKQETTPHSANAGEWAEAMRKHYDSALELSIDVQYGSYKVGFYDGSKWALDQDTESNSSPETTPEASADDRYKEAIQDIQYTLTNPCSIHKYPGSTFDDANMLDSIREIINGLDQDTESNSSPETTPKVSATETSEVKYLIGKAIDFADTHRPDPDCETREDWDRWFEPLCDFHDGLDETKVFQLTTDSETSNKRKDSVLPDCMMPDGDAPCVGYIQVYGRIQELTAENEALMKNENAAIKEISDLEAKLTLATDALERIKDHKVPPWYEGGPDTESDAMEVKIEEIEEIARETLAKLRGKE